MERKLQKPYPTDYNLLIAQNLCQVHDQILLKILLKELIELNVNMDIIMKNTKLAELNSKFATAFLTLRMI